MLTGNIRQSGAMPLKAACVIGMVICPRARHLPLPCLPVHAIDYKWLTSNRLFTVLFSRSSLFISLVGVSELWVILGFWIIFRTILWINHNGCLLSGFLSVSWACVVAGSWLLRLFALPFGFVGELLGVSLGGICAGGNISSRSGTRRTSLRRVWGWSRRLGLLRSHSVLVVSLGGKKESKDLLVGKSGFGRGTAEKAVVCER